MGAEGLFRCWRMLEAISAKGDPLETSNNLRWEDFRADHRGGDGDEARERQEQLRPQAR